MKLQTTLLALVILTTAATAQNRLEIGLEGGLTRNIYKIRENGNLLGSTPSLSGYGGVNLRYNTKKKLFVEMGFLAAGHEIGFGFGQKKSFGYTKSEGALLFPVRFGYGLVVSKKTRLTPTLGLAPVVRLAEADTSGLGVTQTLQYQYTTRSNKNFYLLSHAGLALEWQPWPRMKFSLGAAYYQGLTNVLVQDINYKEGNNPAQKGTLKAKGSFLSTSFGIKYLVK